MKSFMLDTNIFDRVVKGVLSAEALPFGRYLATHTQFDELMATNDHVHRARLRTYFHLTVDQEVATLTFALDVSRLGSAMMGDGLLYEQLRQRVAELDAAQGKRSSAHGQSRDALIAEAAIAHDATLLTFDKNLALAVVELGGLACRPDEVS